MKDLFMAGGLLLAIIDVGVLLICSSETKMGCIINIVMAFITMIGTFTFGFLFQGYLFFVTFIIVASFNWTLVYLFELEDIVNAEDKRKKISHQTRQ